MTDERTDAPDERERGDGAGADKQRVVTYEAADRGAVCCLGCQAWALILGGVGFAVWYLLAGDLWRIIVGLILLIGGFALWRYLSKGRNRWEVSFDRDRRVVTLLSRVAGETEQREIPFDEITAVELRTITRDVSTGEDVPHRLPVFVLASGERVALDERLSIKNTERADEVAGEMRTLLGLRGGAEEGPWEEGQ